MTKIKFRIVPKSITSSGMVLYQIEVNKFWIFWYSIGPYMTKDCAEFALKELETYGKTNTNS